MSCHTGDRWAAGCTTHQSNTASDSGDVEGEQTEPLTLFASRPHVRVWPVFARLVQLSRHPLRVCVVCSVVMSSVEAETAGAQRSAAPSTSDAATARTAKPARRLKAQYRADSTHSTSTDLVASTPAASTTNHSPPHSANHTAVSHPNAVPAALLNNAELNAAILASLPPHYNFEVHKTIHRLTSHHARRVALQLPEGLLAYSCLLSDLLERWCGVECVVLGDVTYGACCVDDYSAAALGCDFLVHYGHSCLVPIDVTEGETGVRVMYVFVDIAIDCNHLVRTLQHNFPTAHSLTLFSTIQFASSLQHAAPLLVAHFPTVSIPQCRPLSKGEVLGCTSPPLDVRTQCNEQTPIVFVADGRFHLESLMIHNPHIDHFYQYDPYSRRLTKEAYGHGEMQRLRAETIEQAKAAEHFGLILGTLGRQGAPHLLHRLASLVSSSHTTAGEDKPRQHTVFLISELSPARVSLLPQSIDCFVQVACPRLSVDWGHEYGRPLLNTYEAEVALGTAQWLVGEGDGVKRYPMDYYAEAGGEWSNYAEREKQRAREREARSAERQQREALRLLRKHQRVAQQASTQRTGAIQYET